MSYTPSDMELISTANLWVAEKKLDKPFKAFIEAFPKKLSFAKEYFSNFQKYSFLSRAFIEKDLPPDSAESKNMQKELAKLEEKLRASFKSSDPNDPNKDIKEYLRLHFIMTGHFTEAGHLSFREERHTDTRDILLENQTKALANKGFIPAHLLHAESLRIADEKDKIEALMNGAKAGDKECQVILARDYLLKRMQKADLSLYKGMTDEEAIKIINKGVDNSMPTAIASVSNFISNLATGAKALYAGGRSESEINEERKFVTELFNINAKLCRSQVINNKLQSLINIGPPTPQNRTQAKKLANEIDRELLPEEPKKPGDPIIPPYDAQFFATERAANLTAKTLTAESQYTSLLHAMMQRLVLQLKKYEERMDPKILKDNASIIEAIKINITSLGTLEDNAEHLPLNLRIQTLKAITASINIVLAIEEKGFKKEISQIAKDTEKLSKDFLHQYSRGKPTSNIAREKELKIKTDFSNSTPNKAPIKPLSPKNVTARNVTDERKVNQEQQEPLKPSSPLKPLKR